MTDASLAPAPGGLPLVGHAIAFLRDKPGFLDACLRQRGDCVRLDLGGPTWLLNDPADVKHVLVDAAAKYQKTPKLTSSRGRELSGEGLHTSNGAEHLQLRRLLQPLFQRRAIEAHAGLVSDVAARHLDRWRPGEARELWSEMLELTQQVLLRVLFGPSFVDSGGELAAAVTARRAYIEHFFLSNLPSPERWPLPVVLRYRKARGHIHRVIDAEVARRRREGAAGDDWISRLVASSWSDGRPLSDRQIRDEMITLTSTGYETVASALTWMGHLLSHHPEVQEELRAEAPPPGGSPGPFMAQVLNEALRLYPPTWLFVRVAVGEDVLPGGAAIRVGDKCYLSPYTMHRHPRWYALPDQFDPGHFAEEAVRQRPRLAFFPFGGGARQCIGEPFARLEANLVMCELLRRVRLEPVRPLRVPLRAAIVLEPRGGLPIRLARPGGS